MWGLLLIQPFIVEILLCVWYSRTSQLKQQYSIRDKFPFHNAALKIKTRLYCEPINSMSCPEMRTTHNYHPEMLEHRHTALSFHSPSLFGSISVLKYTDEFCFAKCSRGRTLECSCILIICLPHEDSLWQTEQRAMSWPMKTQVVDLIWRVLAFLLPL